MVDQVQQQPYVTLNSGHRMPQIGLGTFLADEKVQAIVLQAITQEGYRHIDTAAGYSNEHHIGLAIKDALASGKVTREELFITTKLWVTDYDDIEGAVKRSLTNLQVEYLDLYLIHWMRPLLTEDPETKAINVPKQPIHKIWAELERLVKAGLIRSIGVSNCTVPVLLDILTYAEIKPAVN